MQASVYMRKTSYIRRNKKNIVNLFIKLNDNENLFFNRGNDMKNLSIKLISLSIIILFCLSPLSAIDLTSENNTIIDNSTQDDVKINDKICDIGGDDSQIKDADSANVDNRTKITVKDSEDETADNDTQEDEEELLNPNLSIKVNDVSEGGKVTIEVTAENNFNHYVEVRLSNSDKVYPLKIVNGYGKLTINEDIAPGKYSAKVSYDGDEKFAPDEKSTSFIVKANANLNIKIDNIHEDEKAVAEITANEDINNQYVEVKLSDYDKVYPVKLINGYGKVRFDEQFIPGKHYATVKYEGNTKYNAAEKATSFNVIPITSPNLVIKVKDIYYGNKAVVEITANNTINQYVEVKLNSSDNVYPIKLVNGSGKTTIIENLEPGKYSATVTFDGNSIFSADIKTTTFTVKTEKSPELNIDVDDVYLDEKPIAKIQANSNISDNVEVRINNTNKVFKGKIVNGSGDVIIDDKFSAGDYSATVRFNGDDTFVADEETSQFTVKKYSPNFSISIKNVTNKQRPVVIVKANNTINSVVTLKFNNSDEIYYVNVVNGSGKLTIGDEFNPGEYVATVSYNGNDIFLADEVSSKFHVLEGKKNINLGVKGEANIRMDVGLKILQVIDFDLTTDPDYTGYIEIEDTFHGENYTVKVVNGHGHITIKHPWAPAEKLFIFRNMENENFFAGELKLKLPAF